MPSTHDPFDMNEYTEADMYEKEATGHSLLRRITVDGLRGSCTCLSREAIDVIGRDQSANGAIGGWYAGHLTRALLTDTLSTESHSSAPCVECRGSGAVRSYGAGREECDVCLGAGVLDPELNGSES